MGGGEYEVAGPSDNCSGEKCCGTKELRDATQLVCLTREECRKTKKCVPVTTVQWTKTCCDNVTTKCEKVPVADEKCLTVKTTKCRRIVKKMPIERTRWTKVCKPCSRVVKKACIVPCTKTITVPSSRIEYRDETITENKDEWVKQTYTDYECVSDYEEVDCEERVKVPTWRMQDKEVRVCEKEIGWKSTEVKNPRYVEVHEPCKKTYTACIPVKNLVTKTTLDCTCAAPMPDVYMANHKMKCVVCGGNRKQTHGYSSTAVVATGMHGSANQTTHQTSHGSAHQTASYLGTPGMPKGKHVGSFSKPQGHMGTTTHTSEFEDTQHGTGGGYVQAPTGMTEYLTVDKPPCRRLSTCSSKCSQRKCAPKPKPCCTIAPPEVIPVPCPTKPGGMYGSSGTTGMAVGGVSGVDVSFASAAAKPPSGHVTFGHNTSRGLQVSKSAHHSRRGSCCSNLSTDMSKPTVRGRSTSMPRRRSNSRRSNFHQRSYSSNRTGRNWNPAADYIRHYSANHGGSQNISTSCKYTSPYV